jgi:hypothetical protein
VFFTPSAMASRAMWSAAVVVLVAVAMVGGVAAQDCVLKVPSAPLSARGLASLYLLSGDGCDQTNADTAVFAEAAIVRPSTGQIFVYTPLIVNAADPVAAIDPVVPSLHDEDVVGIWFGSNTDSVTLTDTSGSLLAGRCVNGITGSIFGQVAFCNALAFFLAANQAIARGRLVVPPLRTGTLSGRTCPSTRSFDVVDQDQSDNVLTSYLVMPRTSSRRSSSTSRVAQGTVTNRALLSNATEIDNGSDNRLLGAFLNPALGCTTWTVTDLADPNGRTLRNAQPLNELQAAKYQQAPIALVPAGNPMVLDNNGNANLIKLNAYRVGVDQPLTFLSNASTATYCLRMLDTGLPTIVAQRALTRVYATPDAGTGTNLFTFLAARFAGSWEELKCQQLTGRTNPVVPVTNTAGVATAAYFNGGTTALN